MALPPAGLNSTPRAARREAYAATLAADDKARLSALRDLESPICEAYGTAIVLEDFFQENFCHSEVTSEDEKLFYAKESGWRVYALTKERAAGLTHLVFNMGDHVRKVHKTFYAEPEAKGAENADPSRTGVGTPRSA